MQAMTGQSVHSFGIFEEVACDAGIYTWDIVRNLVFADSALAELFGLDPAATVRGLPLEDYLARVHPDDRPELAKKISEVLVADIAQQNTYRVWGRDGRYRMVAAFGRAFRDHGGSPILYSGIVVPVAEREHDGSLAH
jgi:PAS domain S-box-containing protein